MRGTKTHASAPAPGAAAAAAARAALLALLAVAVALAPAPARADGGLRKGPWLMDPRPDRLTVMLEREAPGPVHVRAEPVAGVDPAAPAVDADSRAAVTLHEVGLAGLRPGVRYRYVVTGPGILPAEGAFVTPPVGFAPVRFVVYGDTRSNAAAHAATVRAIRAEAPDFVLHTGDLVSDGRREGDWQRFFEIERDLLREAPFVPVIGNHEIVRPNSVGVDNYRRYVHCEPSAPEPELDYALAYGNLRLVLADAYHDWSAPDIRAWLDGALARARREVPDGFVIVAMHWGLCSSGPHGENRIMRGAGVDEMLRRHRVDLVLSGHDHLYERGDDRGLRYIVTGGGAAPLYRHRAPRAYTQRLASEHHYVRADVERDRITFTALRTDGTVIDRCVLRASGWDCPDDAPVPAQGDAQAIARAANVPDSPQRRACSCAVPGAPDGSSRAIGPLRLAACIVVARAVSRRRRRRAA